MKHFLGVKVVQGEPQVKDGVDGYKVVYKDGYTSWSPKGTFEEANTELMDITGVPEELLPPILDWVLLANRVKRLHRELGDETHDKYLINLKAQFDESVAMLNGSLLEQVCHILERYAHAAITQLANEMMSLR